MIQRYSIVLWKATNKSGQQQTDLMDCAYRMIEVLLNCPENLRPNFCTTRNLQAIYPFPTDKRSFERYFATKRVKPPVGFPDGYMGYRVSAFSSKNEKDSSSLSLTIGQMNEKATDSFVLKLPSLFDCCDQANANMIHTLFKDLVNEFQPYWGCVYNNMMVDRYSGEKREMPSIAHWINYWDLSSVHMVSSDKINKVLEGVPQTNWDDNCLILKKTALNESCVSDRELQRRVQKLLFG